jgi:DsbC/DsbD-like thiol-disulfide interchange protein
MFMRAFLLSLPALLLVGADVMAASSDWVEMPGGRIRLLTSGEPDAAGALRGALQIDLKPGWKTYWQDPGDAGVPPTIDLADKAGLAGIEIGFPAPSRYEEDGVKWAGYDKPVVFPVTFRLAASGPVKITANVFLGVCETICVPVSASMMLDPEAPSADPSEAMVVDAAFAALPPPATPSFGVDGVAIENDRLIVEAVVPGDPAAADLFLAGNSDYVFGAPQRIERDGRAAFAVPFIRPNATPQGEGLAYTLVGEQGAVRGTIPYF